MTPKEEARAALHDEVIVDMAKRWAMKYREQRLGKAELQKKVQAQIQLACPNLGRKAARLLAESIIKSL